MYLLLVNPKARNNRYTQIERSFKLLLDRWKIKYKIVIIDDLANTEEILKQSVKNNTQAIIAVGGNGTVTSIIDALTNYELPFGVIPMSSNNHLANMLGIRTWQAGIRILANHQIKKKRLGKIGKKYFVSSLVIAPKRNLLSSIISQQGWLKRFIGSNLTRSLKSSHNVACQFKLDDALKIQCQLNTATVDLEDDAKKKIKLVINTATQNNYLDKSIFRTNKLEITSSLNMPIVAGNETIANTPAVIQVTNKIISLIQPQKQV